jgi:hypothetical protein
MSRMMAVLLGGSASAQASASFLIVLSTQEFQPGMKTSLNVVLYEGKLHVNQLPSYQTTIS